MPARLPPTSPAAGSQAATALVGPEGLDPKTGEAGGGAGSVSEPSAPPPSRGSRGPGPRSLGRLCSPCTAGGEAWLGLGGACVRVRQCHSHPDPFVFISCRWVPDRWSQPVAGMNSSAREAEAPVRLRIPRGGGQERGPSASVPPHAGHSPLPPPQQELQGWGWRASSVAAPRLGTVAFGIRGGFAHSGQGQLRGGAQC